MSFVMIKIVLFFSRCLKFGFGFNKYFGYIYTFNKYKQHRPNSFKNTCKFVAG